MITPTRVARRSRDTPGTVGVGHCFRPSEMRDVDRLGCRMPLEKVSVCEIDSKIGPPSRKLELSMIPVWPSGCRGLLARQWPAGQARPGLAWPRIEIGAK